MNQTTWNAIISMVLYYVPLLNCALLIVNCWILAHILRLLQRMHDTGFGFPPPHREPTE